jgi:hypothetical protein
LTRILDPVTLAGNALSHRTARSPAMSPVKTVPVCLLTLLLLPGSFALAQLPAQGPPDATWTANAELTQAQARTVKGLGAMQGVSFHNGKVYLYGDVWDARPRVGVLREYGTDYQPTGRVVWLRKGDKPLIRHPTGLTWHPRWGTFLADTVGGRGIIYRLDWQRAWQDGNLDNAVLNVLDDDAAVNGSRPEFVRLDGRDYLATADYGDVRPELRLYDPEKLLQAKRSSAPGVVAHRVLCCPFNQNLHWDGRVGQLTCVQNVIAGRGWRLDVLDLARAVADGRAWGPGVRVRTLTLPPHDELEGYRPLGEGRGLFVTSGWKDNLVVGELKEVGPRESPPRR